MIKAIIEVDDDCMYYKGKLITFVQGACGDYWQLEDIAETFDTLEEVFVYCLEEI